MKKFLKKLIHIALNATTFVMLTAQFSVTTREGVGLLKGIIANNAPEIATFLITS